MNIIELSIDSIIPYENNPRDNGEAVEFVANCIRRFGFRNPIQVDENNVILCGHTRLLACLSLGMENVPCIRHEGLTEAEKEEQKSLRQDYLASIRANLKSQLDNISILNPDGTIVKPERKHKES